jgi:hypothetical protein
VSGPARALVAALVALSLTACATPYQPKDGGRFGYSETLLAPDMVEVYFDGNSDTPAEHASDYALLRCAEYTLANGYSHFVLLERIADAEANLVSTPVPVSTYGAAYGGGYHHSTVAVGTYYRTDYSPHAYARIRMLGGPTWGAEQAETLDAAFLVQSIRMKYGLP